MKLFSYKRFSVGIYKPSYLSIALMVSLLCIGIHKDELKTKFNKVIEKIKQL